MNCQEYEKHIKDSRLRMRLATTARRENETYATYIARLASGYRPHHSPKLLLVLSVVIGHKREIPTVIIPRVGFVP